MSRIVVDTGPLVALLNARDAHHRWARENFDEIEPPTATCDAVLSEACFLLRNLQGGSDGVMELVERGIITPSFHLEAEAASVRKLMARFASVPMSLADACLVRMAELDSRVTVMTFDGDFKIYRKHGRQAVQVLSPVG